MSLASRFSVSVPVTARTTSTSVEEMAAMETAVTTSFSLKARGIVNTAGGMDAAPCRLQECRYAAGS
jgi:hypothetical protein